MPSGRPVIITSTCLTNEKRTCTLRITDMTVEILVVKVVLQFQTKQSLIVELKLKIFSIFWSKSLF